jgi:hypothetical protein
MNTTYHFAAAALLATVVLAPRMARADDRPEAGPELGISIGGYAAPTWDHSVTDSRTGAPENVSRGKIGVATLVNVDEFALGGLVDGMPGLSGEGRLTVGGVAGWQPRVGSHRYQLLGEMGAERFSVVGGTNMNTTSPDETWLQYVGARLGLAETFTRDGHFELGAWLFVRKNLSETSVIGMQSNVGFGEGAPTTYVVGGYSAGVALRFGLRFDRVTGARSADQPPAPEADAGQPG